MGKGEFHNTEKQAPVTIAEWEEHTHPFGQLYFAAKTVVSPLPSGFNAIMNVDYASRTDSQPVYLGYNMQGAQDSDVTWLIQRITYNASNNVTSKRLTTDAWDNRTTATYT